MPERADQLLRALQTGRIIRKADTVIISQHTSLGGETRIHYIRCEQRGKAVFFEANWNFDTVGLIEFVVKRGEPNQDDVFIIATAAGLDTRG